MPPPSHDPDRGHLRCPYCTDYAVQRMYLGTAHVDSCECGSCGARWDQDPRDGSFRGRSSRPRS